MNGWVLANLLCVGMSVVVFAAYGNPVQLATIPFSLFAASVAADW